MNFPETLRYTKEHEWLRLEGQEGVVGITDFAQDSLGDVESNKTVSDLFAPVSGRVVAVNETLREKPEQVNGDCYGGGWMIRIALARRDEVDTLLDAKAYQAFVASEQAK
jgi:glycine cleavage system H protein